MTQVLLYRLYLFFSCARNGSMLGASSRVGPTRTVTPGRVEPASSVNICVLLSSHSLGIFCVESIDSTPKMLHPSSAGNSYLPQWNVTSCIATYSTATAYCVSTSTIAIHLEPCRSYETRWIPNHMHSSRNMLTVPRASYSRTLPKPSS